MTIHNQTYSYLLIKAFFLSQSMLFFFLASYSNKKKQEKLRENFKQFLGKVKSMHKNLN